MKQQNINQMLEILACPLCKGKLVYDQEKSELLCYESKLAFPVIDNIFVMLVDEARKIED